MPDRNWFQKYGTIVAWLGFGVALVTAVLSEHRFQTMTVPSATAAAAADQRSKALFRPRVELFKFVSDTPNLMKSDHDFLNARGVDSALIASTSYVSATLAQQQTSPPNMKYLFFILVNRGSGQAGSVTIHNLEWNPKSGESKPDGVDILSRLDGLSQQQAWGILIDAKEDMTLENYVEKSHAENICLNFSYTDLDGNSYDYTGETCLNKVTPILIPILPTEIPGVIDNQQNK